MNLESWLAVPLKRTNTTAIGSTLFAMLFLAAYKPEEIEHIHFMRAYAILLMAVHIALHVGTLNALRFMTQLQLAHAEDALTSYRDPRRISHLDLAAAWLGFHSLSPCLAIL
jgi:mannose/fructose/N-acetylgalactosamine-specific phosphotransferase system component IIC